MQLFRDLIRAYAYVKPDLEDGPVHVPHPEPEPYHAGNSSGSDSETNVNRYGHDLPEDAENPDGPDDVADDGSKSSSSSSFSYAPSLRHPAELDQLLEEIDRKSEEGSRAPPPPVPPVAVEEFEERAAPEPQPAEQKDRRARRMAGPRSTENRDLLHLPGLGELRYYYATGQLTAVCHQHGPDCRKSATTDPKGRGSGRPFGMLVAWLERQAEYDSRTAHVHTCRPTLQQRKDARLKFQHEPHADVFLHYGKPKEPGAEEEPARV